MDYLQYSELYSVCKTELELVLNLIINGLPSIFKGGKNMNIKSVVLNLIINGLPSIFKLIYHKHFLQNLF